MVTIKVDDQHVVISVGTASERSLRLSRDEYDRLKSEMDFHELADYLMARVETRLIYENDRSAVERLEEMKAALECKNNLARTIVDEYTEAESVMGIEQAVIAVIEKFIHQ